MNYRFAVHAIVLIATATTQAAFGVIGDSSPRAIALGQSYTALARGPEATFWNPANMGLRNNPKFKWEAIAFGVGIVAENNAFSVQTYNDHFTDDQHIITDADKQDLLGDVPAGGLKFNLDVVPTVVAGLPLNGGIAFPLPSDIRAAITTGFVVGIEGELPKDMFDLMFYGNEFNRAYNISDWDGAGWGVVSLNLSGAKPWRPKELKPYLSELSFGLTLKVLGGGYG
jgi:hypothetical protein